MQEMELKKQHIPKENFDKIQNNFTFYPVHEKTKNENEK